MGVDHDVYVVRGYASGAHVVEQFGRLTVEADHALGKLVADASLDENIAISGAHQERVEAGENAVLVIHIDLLRPHDFGHDPEEGAAVEQIFSVGEDGEFEVTDGCAMHQIPFYRFFSIAQAHSDGQA